MGVKRFLLVDIRWIGLAAGKLQSSVCLLNYLGKDHLSSLDMLLLKCLLKLSLGLHSIRLNSLDTGNLLDQSTGIL